MWTLMKFSLNFLRKIFRFLIKIDKLFVWKNVRKSLPYSSKAFSFVTETNEEIKKISVSLTQIKFTAKTIDDKERSQKSNNLIALLTESCDVRTCLCVCPCRHTHCKSQPCDIRNFHTAHNQSEHFIAMCQTVFIASSPMKLIAEWIH